MIRICIATHSHFNFFRQFGNILQSYEHIKMRGKKQILQALSTPKKMTHTIINDVIKLRKMVRNEIIFDHRMYREFVAKYY